MGGSLTHHTSTLSQASRWRSRHFAAGRRLSAFGPGERTLGRVRTTCLHARPLRARSASGTRRLTCPSAGGIVAGRPYGREHGRHSAARCSGTGPSTPRAQRHDDDGAAASARARVHRRALWRSPCSARDGGVGGPGRAPRRRLRRRRGARVSAWLSRLSLHPRRRRVVLAPHRAAHRRPAAAHAHRDARPRAHVSASHGAARAALPTAQSSRRLAGNELRGRASARVRRVLPLVRAPCARRAWRSKFWKSRETCGRGERS